MRITKIEWRGLKVPAGLPGEPSARPLTRHALLLWVQTDEGLMGVGEASPPGISSQRGIAEIGRLLHDLAPSALGLSPNVALDVLNALAPHSPEGRVVRFGLETAVLDVLGQAAQRPIVDLLGGVIDWVPLVADISFVEPQEAARLSQEAVAAGFRCLRLSLGSRDPEVDVEVVRQVRDAVGDEVVLRADADEAWSPEHAVYVLQRLERFGLDYIEQPVMALDLAGLATVRRSIVTPVAADESLRTFEDARQVIEAGAADVLVVKPVLAGGLRAAKAIMELAAKHGLRSVVASSMETGVATAAGLHLASCMGVAEPSTLGSGAMLEHGFLKSHLRPVRGHITVPQTPGLGIHVDHNAVDRYTTGVMGVTAG